MSNSEYKLGIHRERYVVIEYRDGKRYRHALGTADKNEAKIKFEQFLYGKTLLASKTSKTIAEVYALYIADRIARNKSIERITYAWKNLSPEFGSIYPHHLTDNRIRNWTKMRQATASNGTIHVELGYLRAALYWASKKRIIDQTISIELPQKPRPKTDHISKEQFAKLIANTTLPHVRLFLTLAITTGARMGAILDLTWDRVDFDKRLIMLDNPERDATSKGRAIVPMNRSAFEALATAQKGALSSYVIEWGGLPVKSVKTAFRLLSARSGIKVTPHMLRHSAAVWMAEGGVPMEEISQYLGHSSTKITERVYARFSPGYLQKAASILDF